MPRSVSQTTTVDVSLSPSAQAQTITVESGGAPLVDTTKTDVVVMTSRVYQREDSFGRGELVDSSEVFRKY